MAFNSCRAYQGPKVTNEQINGFLHIDHSPESKNAFGVEGRAEGVGLSVEQITDVVRKLGCKPQVADFLLTPSIDYADVLYPTIESELPAVLGIVGRSTQHLVTVLGHTLSTDRWTPRAERGYGSDPLPPYISTSSWVDHFIINDDNLGMYATLPTDSVRNWVVPQFNPDLHAAVAIGIVPPGTKILGYAVEKCASALAAKLILGIRPTEENRWLRHLKGPPAQVPVCRTLLSGKVEYLKAMGDALDEQGNALNKRGLHILGKALPERFWVTEITLPHLYTGNRRKLGDLLTRLQGEEKEYRSGEITFLAWLPGLFFHDPAKKDGQIESWSIRGHVPLLRGVKTEHVTLDW